MSSASSDARPGQDGHEQAAVLERERRPVRRRRLDRLRQRRVDETAPVGDVEEQPDRDPAEAGPARGRVLDDDDREGDAGRDPAEEREERPVDAAEAEVGTCAVEQLLLRRAQAQPDERGVRDRERERRPERVERADEVDVARQDHRDRRDPGEEDDREPRRLEARVQPAEDLRDLPVGRHRVRDPRGADHARVRGDEEDRRGEDADVDLERFEQGALEAEVLDDAEDRVVRVAALLRRQREQRRQLAADLDHGQGRERHEREREVDREDRRARRACRRWGRS